MHGSNHGLSYFKYARITYKSKNLSKIRQYQTNKQTYRTTFAHSNKMNQNYSKHFKCNAAMLPQTFKSRKKWEQDRGIAKKRKETELWIKITISFGSIAGRHQTRHCSTLPTLVSAHMNKYMKLIFATSDPMQSISVVFFFLSFFLLLLFLAPIIVRLVEMKWLIWMHFNKKIYYIYIHNILKSRWNHLSLLSFVCFFLSVIPSNIKKTIML